MTLGVAIVSYNPRLAWLYEAIDSVHGVADQVEVIDHGSTVKIDRATKRMTNNGDLSIAYNLAVSRLTTDWVMLLTDDDMGRQINMNSLRRDIDYEEFRSDQSVIVSPVRFIGDMTGEWGKPLDQAFIVQENHIPYCSWFKRSVWEQVSGFENSWYFDWHFWVKCVKAGVTFGWNPWPIAFHRCHPDQMTRKISQSDKDKMIDNIRRL